MAISQILISACLLGERVRYDGKDKNLTNTIISDWKNAGLLVPLCPEVSGGLPIPRPAAEIKANNPNLQVINIENVDVTLSFVRGAEKALAICKVKNIVMAILTEGSPSCGSSLINSGNFNNTKISGEGVTTRLLRKNDITVFSHLQVEQAQRYYEEYSKTDRP